MAGTQTSITMKKKMLFLLFGFFCGFHLLLCQSIQNNAITSSGNSLTSGNLQLDFSIGEFVTETFQNTNGDILTQGFHQPLLTTTGITETNIFSDISVYPNPAGESVFIKIPVHYRLMKIQIYDSSGKLLNTIHQKQGLNQINLTTLSSGIYYLRLTSQKQKQKTFKVIKIN